MDDESKLKEGEIVGIYRVIDPTGFGGTLPTAEIISGEHNVGVPVILTSANRRSS